MLRDYSSQNKMDDSIKSLQDNFGHINWYFPVSHYINRMLKSYLLHFSAGNIIDEGPVLKFFIDRGWKREKIRAIEQFYKRDRIDSAGYQHPLKDQQRINKKLSIRIGSVDRAFLDYLLDKIDHNEKIRLFNKDAKEKFGRNHYDSHRFPSSMVLKNSS
nr:hypothetical protein [Dinophyceae sp. MRD-151]